MTTKNTEFLRAITGPKIEYNGSPITRYSTWDIGGGIKVDENPFFGKLNLSIDDQHIIDLIDAHGGGTPDRIESPSGDSFAEATDDFFGMGTSAVISRANHVSGSAVVYTAILPGEGGPSHPVLMSSIAATNADETQSAGIGAHYDPTTDQFSLGAFGAPLDIAEPTAPNHAATKGYVDARPGAEEWSEHAATEDVDLDGHKITGLGDPTNPQDAATKAYVDANSGGGGGGPTIAEGELTLSHDAANTTENVTNSVAQNVRFTRIGDTVTLSGDIYIDVDSAGSATAAFTGLTGAAEPLNPIYNWRTAIPSYIGELDMRHLRIDLRSSGDITFTVITAEARTYRTHFVITYRGAAL